MSERGGLVLPKKTLLADAAQPALIRAKAKTRTGVKSDQEPLKNSLSRDCRRAVPIVAFKLALAPDLSNRLLPIAGCQPLAKLRNSRKTASVCRRTLSKPSEVSIRK